MGQGAPFSQRGGQGDAIEEDDRRDYRRASSHDSFSESSQPSLDFCMSYGEMVEEMDGSSSMNEGHVLYECSRSIMDRRQSVEEEEEEEVSSSYAFASLSFPSFLFPSFLAQEAKCLITAL